MCAVLLVLDFLLVLEISASATWCWLLRVQDVHLRAISHVSRNSTSVFKNFKTQRATDLIGLRFFLARFR